jgi:hypothetical protein
VAAKIGCKITKNGAPNCFIRDCPFAHPRGRPERGPCRLKDDCPDSACGYWHPSEGPQ